MTTPAGWYDDGSGRQRWWDGQQWTEHFAPAASAPAAPAAETPSADSVDGQHVTPFAAPGSAESAMAASGASPYVSADVPPAGSGYPGATAGYPAGAAPAYQPGVQPNGAGAPSRPVSTLGIIGLCAAALGTTLACIPFTAPFAWILLVAGFVVSIISLFRSGAKWPGIVGLSLSVLGSIILAVVLFISAVAYNFGAALDEDGGSFVSPSEEAGPDYLDGTEEEVPVEEGVLGSPVAVFQYEGWAEVTVESATWGTSNGGDMGLEPVNGGYLTLDLLWEGMEGTSNVNPLYFSVEDADGNEGDLDIFAPDLIAATEVPAGEQVRGILSFDVAQSDWYTVIVSDELMQEVARITVEATPR